MYSSKTANPLPATFIRGGTSKGVYLKRDDLPDDRQSWDGIFRGIMGSPDPQYGRQLNGMGGGVSSLSKICVVGAPSPEQKLRGIDCEYTFVQIGIRDSVVDYTGNCGNLSSMIGVFALDEAICAARPVETSSGAVATISAFNTNTNKLVRTTFPVIDSVAKLDLEQTSIAGVHGHASEIVLAFDSPGGARTGKLLPSGNPIDIATVPMSLVDATNPTVFIAAEDLRKTLRLTGNAPIDFESNDVGDTLELIRQQGATAMGLDPTAQAQPKIAIVSPPSPSDSDADVVVHALSMGVLHRAVPMTVGLCLGVAAGVEGTIPWSIVRHSQRKGRSPGRVRIRHPSGMVEVGAEFHANGEVKSAQVIRTGRRLMKGAVWW